jgi:hypothetical protein
MKLKSLVGIIQFLLKGLPTRDYPVLHSRLFALVCRYFGQRSEQFTGLILPTESYRYVGQTLSHSVTPENVVLFSVRCSDTLSVYYLL